MTVEDINNESEDDSNQLEDRLPDDFHEQASTPSLADLSLSSSASAGASNLASSSSSSLAFAPASTSSAASLLHHHPPERVKNGRLLSQQCKTSL
jgi:hypothetical protein